MAKNVKHISHVKSNTVENGKPKLPLASALVEGEIAVNYANGFEVLSIKNDSGDVVTFSSDNYFTEKALGSGFTGENSANTVTRVIEDNEVVISAAFNDLNTKKLDASAYTPTDLSNYYTKSQTSGASEIETALNDKQDASGMSGYVTTTAFDDKLGSGFTGANSAKTVTEVIEESGGGTVDQVMDSGTSASTNAVATHAVYDVIVDNELVWTNAYVVISGAIHTHTANTAIHRVDTVSKTEINGNTLVSCPSEITGATNNGAQAVVIYENTGSTACTVTVTSGYKTPDGAQLILTCPAGGFCKVTYININGQIYVSGN